MLLSGQKNLKVDKDNVIFVYANGFIHAVASIDGEVLWKKELASEGFDQILNSISQHFLHLNHILPDFV